MKRKGLIKSRNVSRSRDTESGLETLTSSWNLEWMKEEPSEQNTGQRYLSQWKLECNDEGYEGYEGMEQIKIQDQDDI